MKPKIVDLIKSGKILVSDGAWGTLLLNKGLSYDNSPDEWNLSHPKEIYEIAKSYIDAGSNLVETNSFGASFIKLRDFNLQEKTEQINKSAVEISRKAAGDDNYVIASIGPTGKLIINDEVTVEELYKAFKQQAIAFEESGADAVCVETFYDLQEAECAIKAVKENTKLELICTFTFEKKETGEFRTMMGVGIADYINKVIPMGVDIVGSNCGNGFGEMLEIIKEIRALNSEIPILVQANAGFPEVADGNLVFPETPEMIKPIVYQMINAGANIIGGCCGTTPEHIKVIANIVKEFNNAV